MGRKDKFHINTYLNPILEVLFYGHSWAHVKHSNKVHISTIIKKFHKWKQLGVFKIGLDNMTDKYIANKKIKRLFIDSTCIQNINCSDKSIQYYHKIKSKKQIKLSILCTENNIPISYHLSNPKEHDSKHVPILVNNLRNNNILLNKNCYIIGDKGYISKKTVYNVKDKKIKIVASKRKNQKSKHNKNTKKLLNKRYIVEQTFSHLKRSYKRLQNIQDKRLDLFETFLVMGLTCQIIRKYIKK